MIVESVLLYIKLHVLPSCIVEVEDSTVVSVIGNSELALEFLQIQNVGGGSFIKLYLTIYFYICFAGSLNCTTIPFYCYGLICCPESCEKTPVAEEVNSGLIIQ